MTDVDGVMRMLSDGNRRRLLLALHDEGEESIHPFSGDDVDRVDGIQLRHVHLPLLEDTNLVAWDRETGAVCRGHDFEAVEPVLTLLDAGGQTLPGASRLEEGETC